MMNIQMAMHLIGSHFQADSSFILGIWGGTLQCMKRRITTEILKLHQARAIQKPNTFGEHLSKFSYELVSDMISDIKRPFLNICIHGRNPQLILPFLKQHNQKFATDKYNITLVDYLRNPAAESLVNPSTPVKQLRYVGGPDSWIPEQNCFDLLISSLETHHSNDEEQLFRKYLQSLKPDGALVGSQFTEGTLKQLYWSYLLAQNERYGGMSPKVLSFPGLGQTGTHLTNSKYQLITILQEEQTLKLQSFVDVITMLQELGETGYLRGRRKGVYRDMLLAASALYHAQFQNDQGVDATFVMSKFIGWKYHETQPKKLKPGPHVGSVEFSQELKKFGDVETYEISQESHESKKQK